MARKTAKDYRKELSAINKEKVALEARIVKRAKDLCKKHSDMVIENYYYISEYDDRRISLMDIDSALHLIDIIEEELANQHPHKQTSIEGF